MNGAAPTANFSSTPTSGSVPLTVQFTDHQQESPTSWFGTLETEKHQTEQNPTHTYTTAGTYTVKLTVTNAAGSDHEQKLIILLF